MRYAVLLAAGSGSRFGGKKQFRQLAGLPVWIRSLQALRAGGVERVVLVVPASDLDGVEQEARDLYREGTSGLIDIVSGGKSRSESVQCGLRRIALESPCAEDVIAIHDAARPFVRAEDIAETIARAVEFGGAVLCRPCTDTVKQAPSGYVERTVPRDELVLAQTPQVFRWDWLDSIYLGASPEQIAAATDDASLMEQAGMKVAVVIASSPNLKLTQPEDWSYAEWLAKERWGDEKV